MAFTALEAQIADLTTKVNALTETYRTKAQAIDTEVANALKAIPNNTKTYYVDPGSGDDTGPGSSTKPFRTIKAACDAVPIGGYGVIRLPLAPVVADIDSNIDLRHKSILIGPSTAPSPGGAQADKASLPLIRQRIGGGGSIAYGFALDSSRLTFSYCRLETATASPNPEWSGMIRRLGTLGGHCIVIYSEIRIGSTSFARRDPGASGLWLQVYGSSIDRIGATGALLSVGGQPAILGVDATTLPASLTLTDLVNGLRRDADGRVVNVLCSEVL